MTTYEFELYGPDRGGDLGPDPTLHDPVWLSESALGPWTEVRSHARLHASTLGAYSYLMNRVQLDYADVGRFCSVATDVRLGPPNHPIERPTGHHFTYRADAYDLGDDDEGIFAWRADHPVEVGHDVWIGHGAVVVPGVTVATGAVVGAGAVVTRDVPPYTVVAGVPAEPIRRRFDPETAARIEATEWWTWDHATIRERIEAFRDLETFLAEFAPPADAASVDVDADPGRD